MDTILVSYNDFCFFFVMENGVNDLSGLRKLYSET